MLYDDQGQVIGIVTGDMGRNAQGEETAQFTPGIEIHARYTLVAEGTRGSLTRQLEGKFDLRRNASPRSEEHTSELQSLMRISYAVFCWKQKNAIKIWLSMLQTS